MKWRIAVILIILALVAYGAWTWMIVSDETDLVFAPIQTDPGRLSYADLPFHNVTLTTRDSVTLHGWVIPAEPEDSSSTWVIIFHDRGRTVRDGLDAYLQWHDFGVNVLAVDYRGFGKSEGTISEAGLYEDAWTAYYNVRYLAGVPSGNIILVGEGLGAAAVVDVGLKVNAAALVLLSPYTSAPDWLQEQYPWLPVSWFMSTGLNSLARIDSINTPKLIVQRGESDPTADYCQQLYDRARKYQYSISVPPDAESVFPYASIKTIVDNLNQNAHQQIESAPLPLADSLLARIESNGVEDALDYYHALRAREPERYDFGEWQLDRLGEYLLTHDDQRAALEIFKLNHNMHPESPHAGTQLASVLIEVGDTDGAGDILRHVLARDSVNARAKELLLQSTMADSLE